LLKSGGVARIARFAASHFPQNATPKHSYFFGGFRNDFRSGSAGNVGEAFESGWL
jgi:hypothetical protein